MEEKAKNLASKEDIAEITEKVEIVKYHYNGDIEKLRINLNKDFQEYMDNMKFLKERSYNQYVGLYSKLYAIIIQSEYFRYLFEIHGEFKDIPFLELEKKSIHEKVEFHNFMTNSSIDKTEEEIHDEITDFNKIKIADMIIENGELATERLLKLAVAYRYVHKHYINKGSNCKLKEKCAAEELKIIKSIVQAVVKETNELKKICNLQFNEIEISTGIMKWEEYS